MSQVSLVTSFSPHTNVLPLPPPRFQRLPHVGQFSSDDLVVPIAELLEMMERTGGGDAFVNIKFNIPTYTSAL